MSEAARCAGCGARDTGWRRTLRDGAVLCPACAQGVKRTPVEEMLRRRRELLARLDAEENAPQGVERFRDEVRESIGILEARHEDTGGV